MLVGACAALLLATWPTPGMAQTQAPPAAFPPRVGAVADGTGSVEGRALGRRFSQEIGNPYGLEGLILVLDDCGDDADRILDRALVHYGLSLRLGEMADDAVAWLVCRESGVARFAYAVRNPYAAWLNPTVVESAMSDVLAGGDPAAAIEAGMAAAASALAPAPRPTALANAPPAEAPSDARTPPLSGIVLLLLAAVALGFGAWRWHAARRPLPATGDWLPRLQELAARAELLKPEIAGNAPRLARLVQRCEPLGEPVRVALYRRHETMVRRLNELERIIVGETGPLATRGAVDDDAPEVRSRREALFVSFESLRAYVDRLDRESARAEHLAGHAPEVIEAAAQVIEGAEERYAATAAALGDDPRLALPGTESAFAHPHAWLARAEGRLAEGRHLAAGRDAEDAADLARRVARAAEGVGAADGRVARAAAALRAVGMVAPDALACVRGNGAEAEAALERVASVLGATLRAPEADLGADPAAGLAANLLVIEASLDHVAALCAALEARIDMLATAAAQAPAAIAAASTALRDLVQRLPTRSPSGAAPGGARPLGPAAERGATVDATADPVQTAIERAEERLVAAERLLAATPPEPAAALRRALEAERWLVEAETSRRGRRIEGRRRRHLAEAVLAELEQDIQLRLDFHRLDAGAVAVRRSEDAMAALDAARAAIAGASGDAHQRLRAMLGATAAAVGVVEEAVGRLASDRAKAERGRAAVRPPLAPDAPLPVAARRGPFPGHFGDWPSVSRIAPAIRAARWGAQTGGDDATQSWGAGTEGW